MRTRTQWVSRGRGRDRKVGGEGESHLFGVHSRGAPGAEHQQAGASVGVQQASPTTLAQCVQDAGLIEVDQGGQVFQAITGWGICLQERTSPCSGSLALPHPAG